MTNSYSGGGAENSISLLHKSFRDSGIESFLLCLNQSETHNRSVSTPGAITLNRGWGDGFFGTLRNFLEFKRVLNSLNSKIIVGNCELPELYLSLISLKNYKAYCVEHTSFPWFGRRTLGYFVRTVLALKKVSWITVSSEAGKIWPTSTSSLHIPNPIAKPSETKKASGELKLVFIGRLRKEKRPDWALQVSKFSGIPIDFYGDGPMSAELTDYAQIHEIDAIFHGYTEGVWNQISENSIVIVPSEFEGDGLTVVEAIVRGLPILLADNIDLLRFGLHSQCYSASALEMAESLKMMTSEKLNSFRPTQNQIERYRTSRSLESVTNLWKSILELD